LYGGGNQVRDWIYVQDFCLGIERALNTGQPGTVYNFSAGNELPNREVAERVMKLLDKPSSLIVSTEDRPGHDFRYSLSSDKARSKLGWKPRHSFDEALGLTVKWYLEHKQWWKPLATEKVLSETPWKEKW
jgi:dTDP-glucose 4,6-dehydratase